MKLYIIMPVINCLELTKDAIASIVTGVSHKIIIIDNASVDGTRDWGLEKQLNLFKQFQYIRNDPKKSVASSWNQGIRVAMEDTECKYIVVLNNDIFLHPKTLNHLMAFMDKTGYLMVTADNIKERMSLETMLRMELPVKFTDYDCEEIGDWRAEGPDFSCYMISPETVKVIGYFDENFKGAYCEDQDYHVRISRAREHAEKHGDQLVEAKRIHAKRLSTAPYMHYSSQTIVRNPKLRHDISMQHGRNQNYFTRKWGAGHPTAMSGLGFLQPFGDARMSWRDW